MFDWIRGFWKESRRISRRMVETRDQFEGHFKLYKAAQHLVTSRISMGSLQRREYRELPATLDVLADCVDKLYNGHHSSEYVRESSNIDRVNKAEGNHEDCPGCGMCERA